MCTVVASHAVDAMLCYANDHMVAVCPILGPLSQNVHCLTTSVMLLRHATNKAVSCHFADNEISKLYLAN